jgi:hypothetical protein
MRLALILIASAVAAIGQIDNPPSSVNITDATATGRAVLTASNAAAAATAIGLGATNYVAFSGVEIVSGGDELQINGAGLLAIGFDDELNFEENAFRSGGNNIFTWSTTNATFPVPATFSTNVTISGTLTATGNVTMSGTANTAPNQAAASGSSIMTRDLSDDRYSFARWYDANDLLAGAQAVGVNPLITGNGGGSPQAAILVTVSNISTKFMLPVDYRLTGQVKVVSYWTDRSRTNAGTNGDIAVWSFPYIVNPTNSTATGGFVSGTSIKNTFTANYGGGTNYRFYVVEQTLDFGTVSGISGTNAMQLKFIELQRRGADASDTSGDDIYLSGVHIFVP